MIAIQKLREALDWPAEKDEELQILREAVEELFERASGRLYRSRTGYVQTVHVEHERSQHVWLHLRPVTSVTLVVGRASASLEWETIDAEDYEVEGAKVSHRTSFWGEGVRVTYSGGYTDDTCPPAIQQALIAQARFMNARFQSSVIHVTDQSFKGGAGTFEKADVHPFFALVANRYARRI